MHTRRARAVVVPDELSLTMWGHDAHALQLEPTNAVGRAEQLLLAEPLPHELRDPLDVLREQLPAGATERGVPVPLVPAREVEHGHPSADHGEHAGHEEHDHHGGHDHGDMMAIVGEPSADGLVMEKIELRYGPLATALPGGLVLEVELDGDVVSRCTAEAGLAVEGAEGPQRPPDPLATAAWTVLIAELTELAGGIGVSPDTRRRRLAAVELERALSHAAWLRSLGRLLGWQHLVERCQSAVTALLAARAQDLAERASGEAAASAQTFLEELAEAVETSRLLRRRLAGLGRVTTDDAPGLQGPNARASGEPRDARSAHPLYAALDFEPVVEADGDARARTVVRAREAVQALDLASRMLEEAGDGGHPAQAPAGMVAIEGPRGPVVGSHGERLQLAAPGVESNLAAAERAAVGLEWSAALVTVASFDLSPWRVPA